MAKYRLLYVVIWLGSAAFALAYESKLTFVLLVGVTILPAASLILLVMSGLLMKIELIPTEAYVGKMQHFSLTIKLTNRFIIPAAPVLITGVFHEEDGTIAGDRHIVLSAAPFSKSEYVFGGCIRYRGEYTLGVQRAVIYDLLRIFRFRLGRTPMCAVTVTPRRIMLDETNALCADDYESSLTNISFMDSNSFVSVRKYADGDLMKHVHWKLTAKHDELMVKEMEQNLGSSAVIITDIHAVSEDGDENMRVADACIEAALAITRKIISDGRSAVNVYRTNDKTTDILSAEKNEDYEQLLSIFAVLPITEVGKGAESMISKATERLTGTEPIFIITTGISAKAFSGIIERIGSGGGEIRIYTTEAEPSPMLIAAAETVRGASVNRIDPDDVAVSLRNTLR